MRFTFSAKCMVLMMFLAVMSGCHSSGTGSSGGWRMSSWNPANWRRPASTASSLAENAPKKPSDLATPSVTVSPGVEATASSLSPTTNYANTAASFNAPTGYAGNSSYPNISSGTVRPGLSTTGPRMSPQSGFYGNYAGGSTNDSTTPTPEVTVNPYRSLGNAPAAATGAYQSADSSYGTTPSSTNAQYTASLNSSASRTAPAYHSNDPNSRFYSGPSTSAQLATPSGPYASNAGTGAYAPVQNGVANTGSLTNSTVNGQSWNAGNYSSAPQRYTPGATAYTPEANRYSPGASDYTPGTNYYSTPTSNAASPGNSPAPPSSGSYYGNGSSETGAGISSSNNASASTTSPAPTTNVTSASWTPGSCTSYPTTDGSSMVQPTTVPSTTAPSRDPYSASPYPSTSTSSTNSDVVPAGFTPEPTYWR